MPPEVPPAQRLLDASNTILTNPSLQQALGAQTNVTPEVRKQNEELQQQATKAMGEVRDRAGKRLTDLRSNMSTPDPFRAFQGEVREARKVVQALPASHEEVQQTLKTLDQTERDLEQNIKDLTAPPPAPNQQNPEQLAKSFREGQRKAGTNPQARMRAAWDWVREHADNWIAQPLLGFAAGFLKIMPFEWAKKFGRDIERYQAPGKIHKVMTDALPSNKRGYVKKATMDVEDAIELREEYDNKKRLNENNFATNYPDFDKYVRDRMREVDSSRPNTRYTIRDLLEHQGRTPAQREAAQKEAKQKENEVKTNNAIDRLAVRARLQKRYAEKLIDALLTAEYKGDLSFAPTDTYQQIGTKIATAMTGKQWGSGTNSKTGWQIYIHENNLHEYDRAYWGLGILSHDDKIVGFDGIGTLLTTDPRAALMKFKNWTGEGQRGSIDDAATATLRRIKANLAENESFVKLEGEWRDQETTAELEIKNKEQEVKDAAAAKNKAEAAKNKAEAEAKNKAPGN